MSPFALAVLAAFARGQEVAVSTPVAISTAVAVSTEPAPGGAGSVRILSIGDFQLAASMPHLAPFERVLADRRGSVELLDVENVPAYVNGGSFKYRLPEAMQDGADPPSTGTAKVAALESEYGYFLLWPAEPALLDAALDSFRRPDRYRRPMSPRVSERKAGLLVAPAAEGGWVHAATIETPRQTAGQWRKTLATAYRLRVGGRRVEDFFLKTTLG
ncbi:MAG: hypothetical protein HY553_06150, partial [Elusimicrobia bacterium]|nr:hypothetical protein [Elusimicrobiota bacterium]